MKWLDEITEARTRPLRVTWVDKALVLAQLIAVIGLVTIGLIAFIQWLLSHA